MENIITARLTPRFENGRLYFYEGNTFTLAIEIELKMTSGESFPIESNSKIYCNFYDETDTEIATKTFSNITNSRITLDFDKDFVAKFPKGKYFYDIIYDGSCRVTLADHNQIIVE